MGLGLRDAAETPSKAAVDQDEEFRSGANWFYWIVGFSVLSTFVQLFGRDWGSIVGLAVTRIFDAAATGIAEQSGGAAGSIARGISLGLDVVVYGVFLLLGWLATRRHAWAFVVGMVLYAGDTLIYLLFQGWLSALFHAFVLSRMWVGFISLRKLQAAAQLAAPAPGMVPLGAAQTDAIAEEPVRR